MAEREDELATHSMTTKVWISTRGKMSEPTRTTIQKALEADTPKDTSSFGMEDLDTDLIQKRASYTGLVHLIHRSFTKAGLVGIYNFPGAVYATDGSNDKRVMGAGFYRLDENRGGSYQLERGEEATPPTERNLGAACLALEDAKGKEDRKPIILLSNSPCFLSSSQK